MHLKLVGFFFFRKKGDRYIAKSGSKTLSLKDNFSLADSVVEAEMDGKTSVVQLINRHANGTLRIRYKGEKALK